MLFMLQTILWDESSVQPTSGGSEEACQELGAAGRACQDELCRGSAESWADKRWDTQGQSHQQETEKN